VLTSDRSNITVVIPAHHSRLRNGMLTRALASVWQQTLLPNAVIIQVDEHGAGAAATRNSALEKVNTPFTAFLDSDDELLPNHLHLLHQRLTTTGADVAYPWFTVIGGTDPLERFGVPFDPAELDRRNYIPVTTLVRTEAVVAAGGFQDRFEYDHGATCEEWQLWLTLRDRGARFEHVPERTWRWHHHTKNTGGRAGYGDA